MPSPRQPEGVGGCWGFGVGRWAYLGLRFWACLAALRIEFRLAFACLICKRSVEIPHQPTYFDFFFPFLLGWSGGLAFGSLAANCSTVKRPTEVAWAVFAVARRSRTPRPYFYVAGWAGIPEKSCDGDDDDDDGRIMKGTNKAKQLGTLHKQLESSLPESQLPSPHAPSLESQCTLAASQPQLQSGRFSNCKVLSF